MARKTSWSADQLPAAAQGAVLRRPRLGRPTRAAGGRPQRGDPSAAAAALPQPRGRHCLRPYRVGVRMLMH